MRISRKDGRSALVWLTAFVVACGGGGDGQQGGGEMAGGEAGGPALEDVVDLSSAGSIEGSVSFAGTAPEPQPIDMAEEPTCAEKYDNGPVYAPVEVNDNGTLRWVFVYVREGRTADGQDLSGIDFPVPGEPVMLDQDGCRYDPHVFGIQIGQTLQIQNSDGLLHNINARPDSAGAFNISQPVSMTSTRTFNAAEVMVPIRCDVHGWMQAFGGVVEHPYHAVTGGDGSFTIDRLPPGTYTIEAWHEEYGTQTQEVTVEPNGMAEVSFTFGDAAA